MNQLRMYIIGMLLSSLLGYLEWGDGNEAFLFQTEWEVLQGIVSSPGDYLNPFVLVPLLGQVLLIIAALQRQPNKWLTLAGTASIGLLMGMLLFVGLLLMLREPSGFAVAVSAIPFWICAFLALRLAFRKAPRA